MQRLRSRGWSTRVLAFALSACMTPCLLADNSALIDLLALLRDKGTLTSDEYAMLVAAAQAESAAPAVAVAPAVAPLAAAQTTTAPAAAPIAATQTAAVTSAATPAAGSSDKLAWAEKNPLEG